MTQLHNHNSVFTETLTKQNDHFNLLPTCIKIEKYILSTYKGNKASYRDNTLALIGEWGSGKSTVIYNLHEKFTQNKNFLPIYFNAWEYQKDLSFSYSIISRLYHEYFNQFGKVKKGLLEQSREILRNTSVSFGVPGIASIDLPKPSEVIEDTVTKSTYYEHLCEFKRTYSDIINDITQKYPNGIIVFIDDLDRCDADNVMDLLSDLRKILSFAKDSFDTPINDPSKLLKIIFVIAVDKNALRQAIITKYSDLLEPSQYLEKIIDRSFSMPKNQMNKRILQPYFGQRYKYAEELVDFLTKIDYINPRKIKLMLNHLENFGLIDELKKNYMKLFFVIYLYIIKQESELDYLDILEPSAKFAIASELSQGKQTSGSKVSAETNFRTIMSQYQTGSLIITNKHIRIQCTLLKRGLDAKSKDTVNFTLFALWFGPKYKNPSQYKIEMYTRQDTDMNSESMSMFYPSFLKAIDNPRCSSAKFINYIYRTELAEFTPFNVQEVFEIVEHL